MLWPTFRNDGFELYRRGNQGKSRVLTRKVSDTVEILELQCSEDTRGVLAHLQAGVVYPDIGAAMAKFGMGVPEEFLLHVAQTATLTFDNSKQDWEPLDDGTGCRVLERYSSHLAPWFGKASQLEFAVDWSLDEVERHEAWTIEVPHSNCFLRASLLCRKDGRLEIAQQLFDKHFSQLLNSTPKAPGDYYAYLLNLANKHASEFGFQSLSAQ